MHLPRLVWPLGAAIALAVAFASAAPAQILGEDVLATGGGKIIRPGPTAPEEVTFGFVAAAGNEDGGLDGFNGHCNVVDKALDVKIDCLDVVAYVQIGTVAASVFGNASVNNVIEPYVIDVTDGGEAGATDTFSIKTFTYELAGTVVDGDIQIGPPRN